ncbi:MAG: hypothetical protein RR582_06810 [Niameybacter sp.]
MPVLISQVGGFIPQTNIKITDSRKDTLITDIKIERRIDNGEFITILQTDSGDNQFSYNDINEFGKVYQYKVSANVMQKQKVANTSTNKANFWKENFTLKDLKIDSTGKLYGTGTATAKDSYLKRLNANGQTNLNMTAWIGNGGDKKGKFNSEYNNILFNFVSGEGTKVSRFLYLTKAWDSKKAYDKRFWYYLNKKDVDGKRVQIQLTRDKSDGIDLNLYFKKSGRAYTYGFSSLMASLKKASGLSSKGGRATSFIISLKNGAKLSPDFSTKVTTTTYVYKVISNLSANERVIVRDEPDIDYGIVINEFGEGFRFREFDSNGVINNDEYEMKSTSQILDIQDSEFPLVYVNDNKKTPSTNIDILVDNIAFRNRMAEKVIKHNYIYIFMPKKWKRQLRNGFYAYESVIESRVGNSDDVYMFSFKGARQVLSNISMPPKWSYDQLRKSERNYISLMDNFRDYEDLAVSPTGTEIPGKREED